MNNKVYVVSLYYDKYTPHEIICAFKYYDDADRLSKKILDLINQREYSVSQWRINNPPAFYPNKQPRKYKYICFGNISSEWLDWKRRSDDLNRRRNLWYAELQNISTISLDKFPDNKSLIEKLNDGYEVVEIVAVDLIE